MHLPPLLLERPFALQLVIAILVPLIFGLITGFALGWNEIAYWVLSALGVLGGIGAGFEHRGTESGVARGILGGLLFGSFILLGHEIANNEPKAHLAEPQSTLVFVTTILGAIFGGIGGRLREKQEHKLRAAHAS